MAHLINRQSFLPLLCAALVLLLAVRETDASTGTLRKTHDRFHRLQSMNLTDDEHAQHYQKMYRQVFGETAPFTARHKNGTDITWNSIRDVPRKLLYLPACTCVSEAGAGFRYTNHPSGPACGQCNFQDDVFEGP